MGFFNFIPFWRFSPCRGTCSGVCLFFFSYIRCYLDQCSRIHTLTFPSRPMKCHYKFSTLNLPQFSAIESFSRCVKLLIHKYCRNQEHPWNPDKSRYFNFVPCSIWRIFLSFFVNKMSLSTIILWIIPSFVLHQLPFALIPVLQFTGDQTIMRSFKNGR